MFFHVSDIYMTAIYTELDILTQQGWMKNGFESLGYSLNDKCEALRWSCENSWVVSL